MMSDYTAMSIQEVIRYVEAIPGLFPRQAKRTGSEIGDGNMNFVFRLAKQEHGAQNSVIVKQALPYMRSVGASWPLTTDRLRIEYEVLTTHNDLCPGLVPKVYHYDSERSLIVMEDLASHIIFRNGLISKQRYPHFALQIGLFLARTLFLTSEFALDKKRMESNRERFRNPEMSKITSDFIFTFPYFDHEMNRYNRFLDGIVHEIWTNHELKCEVAKLKEKFNTCAQALIHGDFHTGSIMVTEQDTKVIDPEFAFYGPMGFDIGTLFANLLINYCSNEVDSHPECDNSKDYQMYLLKTIELIWLHFEAEFRNLWDKSGNHGFSHVEKLLIQLLQDSLGFAGCEMIRRVIGTSHVLDLEKIEDPVQRALGETFALCIGQHLILQRNTTQNVRGLTASVRQVQKTFRSKS